MRIVAGTHGSRKLNTLEGTDTRPTGDKARGAMFSRIGPFFSGGRFLDLFGGSGACGLEAISRGMEAAVFVEKNPKAVSIIQKNIIMLKESDRCTVIKGDALRIFASLNGQFDVVFLDPPYRFESLDALVEIIATSDKVHQRTDIIIETDSKTVVRETYGDFEKIQSKSYGLASLHYYKKKEH